MSSKVVYQMQEEKDAWAFAESEDYEKDDVAVYEVSSIESAVWESDDERYERELLESLNGIYDTWMTPTWPQKRIQYPSVKFMVDHNAPRPKEVKPLSDEIIAEMKRYKEQKDILWKKQKEKEKQVKRIEADMEEEKKKPITYSQKWSEKIKGGESDAIKHLKIQLAQAQKSYNEVKEESEKFEYSYASLTSLVNAHTICKEAFDECEVAEKKMMRAMWGTSY